MWRLCAERMCLPSLPKPEERGVPTVVTTWDCCGSRPTARGCGPLTWLAPNCLCRTEKEGHAHSKLGSCSLCCDHDHPRDLGPDPRRFHPDMAARAKGGTRARGIGLSLRLYLSGIWHRSILAAHSRCRFARSARLSPRLAAVIGCAPARPQSRDAAYLGSL